MAIGRGLTASSAAQHAKGNDCARGASASQALEIARESQDGALDPTISNILESALSQIWARTTAQPALYVMSREEFAIFNYFQHRFVGSTVAQDARTRYWDNASAPPPSATTATG